MIFISITTSGMGPDAWPVELGLARLQHDRVVSHSRLVRPHPTWSSRGWETASAARHRIPRAALDAAPTASQAAAWLARIKGRRPLASLDPPEDGRLLDMIATAGPARSTTSWSGVDMLWVDPLIGAELGAHGAANAWTHLDAYPPRHRAGLDAARLAQTWLAGIAESRRRGEPLGLLAAATDMAPAEGLRGRGVV